MAGGFEPGPSLAGVWQRASDADVCIFDLAAAPEHLPLLAQWHQQEWSSLNPGETLVQRIERMQAYLEPDLVPSMFVCLYRGQLAGSAALVGCDMDTRPSLSPWLASVFVAPQFRCLGLGSRLVAHATARAAQSGFSDLYLFTPDRTDFYRRLGWIALGAEDYYGHCVQLMRFDAAKQGAVLVNG